MSMHSWQTPTTGVLFGSNWLPQWLQNWKSDSLCGGSRLVLLLVDAAGIISPLS